MKKSFLGSSLIQYGLRKLTGRNLEFSYVKPWIYTEIHKVSQGSTVPDRINKNYFGEGNLHMKDFCLLTVRYCIEY